MRRFIIGAMRFSLLWLLAAAWLQTAAPLDAQIIPFESNGLHYQAMTKGGLTVMFAYLPARLKEYAIIQVSISNGSPIAWMMKPEDFGYRRQEGGVVQAAPALTVVNSLLGKASKHDVIKLVTTYENGVFGNVNMQTTNGYESRREAALAYGVSARIKAGAAASAIALVPTKLLPGQSTDGAVFFPDNAKPMGPGVLVLHAAGETFEFPSDGEPLAPRPEGR